MKGEVSTFNSAPSPEKYSPLAVIALIWSKGDPTYIMNMLRILSAGLTAFVVAASQTVAFAQATPATTTGTTPPGGKPGTTATDKAKALAPADKKFVKDASESLYYELALLEKTKIKASTDAVKKLGEKMNDELKKVWEELAAFAQPNNEKMATELSGGDKSAAERVGKLEGDKFDKQLLNLLGKEAKKLSRTFESKGIQTPELKKIAENHAPTLKSHVSEVEKAEKEAAKPKQ